MVVREAAVEEREREKGKGREWPGRGSEGKVRVRGLYGGLTTSYLGSVP